MTHFGLRLFQLLEVVLSIQGILCSLVVAWTLQKKKKKRTFILRFGKEVYPCLCGCELVKCDDEDMIGSLLSQTCVYLL